MKNIEYCLKTKVLGTIREYQMIAPGEKVIVGVSGGPDSMALLYILHNLQEELDCKLHIAHLNHKLRGEESDADAEYVKEHSKILNLPITIEEIDVSGMLAKGESVEIGARRIRYSFYQRVMASINASKVALGHNADDQAETVIMRLIRGSGTQGLRGIPPVRDGVFIRPIIGVERVEIEKYLQSLNISPRIDSSNLSGDYHRNRIRLELLPALRRDYNPNISNTLQQTADILRAEDDLLTEIAEDSMNKCLKYRDIHTIILCISCIESFHVAIQRRILRNIIKCLVGDLYEFDFDHIEYISSIMQNETGRIIKLPRGIYVEKSYDDLIVRSNSHIREASPYFDYPVNVPGETYIQNLKIYVKTEINQYKKDFIKAARFSLQEIFDYGRIAGPLHIRNRRPGDWFYPLGISGKKKIKDFFIDEKVPRSIRDAIPIIGCGDDIIWIVGYRIDDRFKINDDTRNMLTITVRYTETDRLI